MRKKGFTLIELLAVITLIAILTLTILPTITNQINNKKGEVSETYQKLLFHATELYMDKFKNTYPMVVGNRYCIPLKSLVDEGYLDEPLKDPVTKREIEVLTKISDGSYTPKTKIEVGIVGTIDVNYRFIDENEGVNCQEIRQ